MRGARYRAPTDVTTLAPEQAFFPPLTGAARLGAPPALHAAGDLALLRAPARVSIVGTRHPTEAGLRRAARLARLLAAQGIVVVSGLARGIDHTAHTAAMAAGGRAIAVIGTPLDRCYPIEHARLQEVMYRRHLLVSQFESGQRVTPSFFPARNRTMALLSHASVVVEAGDRSGTLSQAAEMQRLGRPVFIMRNIVDDQSLTWPASFLRQGAHVLDDAEQVVAALGHEARQVSDQHDAPR